ncbi:GGDEF domain-containing protein [Rhodoferax sp. PAMC 29310]|uniref:GGDEF domain-containing protein n=1 Tax=Rhodoferax sp. PAMC 29310 TaxID=2822760 RepID=UPI001B32F275|nr:GGDEF domain-containing protein [Rhodoferax sp. PAMC 29310]
MSQLVDSLANLTSLRDRDALDIALVSAINDLLQPQSTAIYQVVGEEGRERWLSSAKMSSEQAVPTFDSTWTNLETLPLLTDYPLRQQTSLTGKMTRASTQPDTTTFSVIGAPGSAGVLELETQDPLTDETIRVIQGVLRLYANFHSLLDYGERDALTELLNRKTFDGAFLKATVEQKQVLPDAVGQRRETGPAGSYWLAMIDIDHFKRVNDTFGHLIGDEVLLLLARIMRATFRFNDQLYRFGGEEFVVLMRCNGEEQASGALERLRTTTEGYLFPQVGRITISVGFSEVRSGDTPSGAFERADKAVYFAKEHGRNQVCSHGSMVARGDLLEQTANEGDIELF